MDDVHASQVVATVRHVMFNNIQFDCAWSTPKRRHVTKTSSSNSLEVSDRSDTTTDGSQLIEEHSSSTMSELRFSPDSRSLELCPSTETNGSCEDSIISELADSLATQPDFSTADSPLKAPRSATQSSKPAARRRVSNRAVRALSDDCDSTHVSSSIDSSRASPSPMSPLSPLSTAPTLTIPLGQHHMSAMATMYPCSYVQVSLDHAYAATPMTNTPTFPTAMLHNRPMGLPVQVQIVPYPSPSGPWYFVPHNPR